MMNKMTKCFMIISLALLGGNLLNAQNDAPPPKVYVDTVKTVKESDTKEYIGKLKGRLTVDLRARVTGILQKVHCKGGSLVKEGDLLMEIEDTTYRAQVQSAEAKLAQIDAELQYAKHNYERQKSLAEKKIVSESTMEDATRLIRYTTARRAEAEAALIDAKNTLAYTKIYAPISGRIGDTTYSRGNLLSPSSDSLATIRQTQPIDLKVAISEPDYIRMFGTQEKLKKDAVVRLRTADGVMFPEVGTVRIVDNQIDPQTGTLMLWVQFPNTEDRLIPGSIVDAFISKKDTKEYPAAKISAIMIGKTGHYVYVLTPDNKVMMRPVETGDIIGDLQIIRKGLEPGERIIVDGTHKAIPGGTVIPVETESQAPAAQPAKQ